LLAFTSVGDGRPVSDQAEGQANEWLLLRANLAVRDSAPPPKATPPKATPPEEKGKDKEKNKGKAKGRGKQKSR
jgi:hypothetical protein